MTEKPPRKRFQIHLSTAIVMMFVTGGILWVNAPKIFGDPRGYHIKVYGWPRVVAIDIQMDLPGVEYEYTVWIGNIQIRVFSLILDLSLALSAILATWFLCEWQIRRRMARKGV